MQNISSSPMDEIGRGEGQPPENVLSTGTALCPYCRSTDCRTEYEGVADYYFQSSELLVDLTRCRACGSLWQIHPPSAEQLAAAYATYYTHELDAEWHPGAGKGVKAALIRAYIRARFEPGRSWANVIGKGLYRALAKNTDRLELYGRFAPPPPAAILDYGCGSGQWLARMAVKGYAVQGVDFDPQAIAVAQAGGISVCTPEQADERGWHGKFDLISICHVIEHVEQPADLLVKLHSLLKPGGLLYCEAPNAEAQGLAIFGKYWRGLEAPRHLAIPSRIGLISALERAGFAVSHQVVVGQVRNWVWEKSLTMVPEQQLADVRKTIAAAADETLENAEYLSVVASR